MWNGWLIGGTSYYLSDHEFIKDLGGGSTFGDGELQLVEIIQGQSSAHLGDCDQFPFSVEQRGSEQRSRLLVA